MDQKELEGELLALCLDFKKFTGEYETLTEVERTIRNVYSRSAEEREKLYPARDALSEFVRGVALESDQAWRETIIRVAERIHKAYTEVAGMRRDALVSSREIEAIELLERIHPHVDSAALREEIDEFMLADDEPEDPRETEGDLRMHDPEGKA